MSERRLAFGLGMAVSSQQDAIVAQESGAIRQLPDPVAAQPASQGVSPDAELHNRVSRILQMLEELDRRSPADR